MTANDIFTPEPKSLREWSIEARREQQREREQHEAAQQAEQDGYNTANLNLVLKAWATHAPHIPLPRETRSPSIYSDGLYFGVTSADYEPETEFTPDNNALARIEHCHACGLAVKSWPLRDLDDLARQIEQFTPAAHSCSAKNYSYGPPAVVLQASLTLPIGENRFITLNLNFSREDIGHSELTTHVEEWIQRAYETRRESEVKA